MMAIVAVDSGFSAAFGAFVMGSILAETVEAERIATLVGPVKDWFGAIFFVSVGMLVDPAVLVEYAWPIVALVLTIILGQAVFGTFGFILAGQPLKEAMKCGFSMSQIGEFAFIIASLGMSLGVTSHHLYPVVVAVSVITTFTTPYMLKAAGPAYGYLCRILPKGWVAWLERYTPGTSAVVANHSGKWHKLIAAMVKQIVVFTILSMAVIALSFRFLLPFLREVLPHWWANAVFARHHGARAPVFVVHRIVAGKPLQPFALGVHLDCQGCGGLHAGVLYHSFPGAVCRPRLAVVCLADGGRHHVVPPLDGQFHADGESVHGKLA